MYNFAIQVLKKEKLCSQKTTLIHVSRLEMSNDTKFTITNFRGLEFIEGKSWGQEKTTSCLD